jgi:peptidyl-prolyl cis-trans isomerase SurA
MKYCLLTLLFSIVVFFSNILHGEQKRVDSILASVNGEPISLLDVIIESGREEKRLIAVFSGEELYKETKKLRKSIIDSIIARKLIYADYLKNPFEIPDQYTEDTMDMLAADFGDGSRKALRKKAKELGTSLSELKKKAKEKVIVEIMVSEYCHSYVNVTPKEIYDYYTTNKKEFSKEPRVHLQLLMLSFDGRYKTNLDEKIEEIEKESASGNENIFKTLVVMNSEGPESENGGDLGWIEESKLRPEFAKALKGVSVGKITAPIKMSEGIYFLRLAGKKDQEVRKFSEVEQDIKEKIKKQRYLDVYKKYIDRLKKDAVIRYYF